MVKILKYLKRYAPSVLVIIGLLLIQAYCDLSLPSYTSDIVNVGIEQGGVDSPVPKVIRVSEMDRLTLFVSSDDKNTILDAYQEISKDTVNDSEWQDYVKQYPVLADENLYLLKDSVSSDKAAMTELKSLISKPLMILMTLESDNDTSSTIKEQMTSQMEAAQAAKMAQMTQQGDSSQTPGMTGDTAGMTNDTAGMTGASAGMSSANLADADVFTLIAAMPEESREAMLSQMEEKFDGIQDSIVEQSAVSYVKSEYQAIGIDVDKIQSNYIKSAGVRMLALSAVGVMAAILAGFFAARAAAGTGRDLRGRVFRKVIGFSSQEFDKFSTASLITRSTNDIQQIQLFTVMFLRLILYAPILGIGGIIKVFQIDTSMTWIIGVAVAAIVVIVLVLFFIVMPKFKLIQKQVDRLNLVSREILTGVPVIRAFGAQKHEEERFDDANMDLTKTNLFVNRVMSCMMPMMMLIMNLSCVLIVWKGGHEISAGQMQVGNLMAFIQYTMQIIISFLMMCMVSIILPRASVAANRIDEVLTSKTAINDKEEPEKLPKNAEGTVRFNHVSFKYPGAEDNVLSDLDFTAKPGETTAIIGSTGSGKSTMMNLIPRFYDVTEGSITIDGVDIRDISQHDLRDQLGYVPQKGMLFSGTIASNITYGKDDATTEEMERAARIAQAEEFIDSKSSGYDSFIAQGGANVSGGQKQRLSIARAIAKDPKVYIFDDSFSALDYKTDVTLRNALKKEVSNSTVFIVAQRISTILRAEQILVLDDGRIVGKGTHEELLRSCETYRQIALSQLSEKELNLNKEQAEGGELHE